MVCRHLHISAKQCTDAHRYIHTYHQPTNIQTNAPAHAHSQSAWAAVALHLAMGAEFFFCLCFCLDAQHICVIVSYAHSPLVRSGARPPKTSNTCVFDCILTAARRSLPPGLRALFSWQWAQSFIFLSFFVFFCFFPSVWIYSIYV